MTDLLNRGMIVLNDRDGDAASGRESTIIVTGVARGGTSMLAQGLENLGLFLGDLRDPVVVEDREILVTLQNFDMDRLEGIIADRNQRFAKWGFKVPNLHNFLAPTDAWRFRNPRYVVVFRDPLAVARRMELSTHQEAAESIREAGAELMKLTSYVCALAAPTLLISYEKALRNAEHLIEMMIAFCGLRPTDEQRLAALENIIPDNTAYIWATQTVFLGAIDNIEGNTLRGWCCYRDSADVVEVEVFADDKRIGIFSAEDYRADLKNAGLYLGFHAFNVDLTVFNIYSSCAISVRPSGRLLALPNSGRSFKELQSLVGI